MDGVLIAFAVSFGVVFVAELGDKSQLMALTFATRYRPLPVLIGITIATAVVHAVSVAVGYGLGSALPTGWIALVAAIAFFGFGAWTLRGDTLTDDERAKAERSTGSAVVAASVAFFLAELGDKTMLATITLATRYGWFGTWLGSTLGMVAADALAILVGRLLGRHLPERAIKYGASGLFFLFGAWLLVDALRTAQPGLADRGDRRGAQPPPRRLDRARARPRSPCCWGCWAAGGCGAWAPSRPSGVAAGHAGVVGPRRCSPRRAARARGPAAGRDGRRAADRAVRRAGLGRGRGRGGAAGHGAADRGAALPGGAAGAGCRSGVGDARPARPRAEPRVDRDRAGHGRAAAHGADAARRAGRRAGGGGGADPGARRAGAGARRRHGEAYEAYAARTGRFLPRPGAREPERTAAPDRDG